MIPVERLSQLSFFQGLPAWAIRSFAESAMDRQFEQGEYIVQQHDEAQWVYFLMSGGVQFLICFEGVDDFLVGTTDKHGALLGWSAFRKPYRYTASVRCEDTCEVIKIPLPTFRSVFRKDPLLGYILLKRVASALAARLEQTRGILVGTIHEPTSEHIHGDRH